jgi:hypothetical protein
MLRGSLPSVAARAISKPRAAFAIHERVELFSPLVLIVAIRFEIERFQT